MARPQSSGPSGRAVSLLGSLVPSDAAMLLARAASIVCRPCRVSPFMSQQAVGAAAGAVRTGASIVYLSDATLLMGRYSPVQRLRGP